MEVKPQGSSKSSQAASLPNVTPIAVRAPMTTSECIEAVSEALKPNGDELAMKPIGATRASLRYETLLHSGSSLDTTQKEPAQ